MSYPNQSGYVRHSDTSQNSAKMLDESGHAGNYDRIIMDSLAARGLRGATADELRRDMRHAFPHLHNGTINGRLSTLWKRRSVIKATETRITDAGRPAHVYVHAQFRGLVVAEPEFSSVAARPVGLVDPVILDAVLLLAQNMIINETDGSAVIRLTPMETSILKRAQTVAENRKGKSN